ncbi:DUF4280 domain-containing protein [Aquimarina sp. LLG6339-5]|uniref:DUF4280 domain-containing protein n=1 Tax=Aquimarina sp. LLG6339-5 TaxID=3160830 RepID=UPI00386AC6D9
MSKQYVLVQGAQCKCQFGDGPDKLKVLSHSKFYASDQNAADKLIATSMELGGATFEANTFGQCKLQPTGSSFKPCQIVVMQWDGFYKDVELGNGGKILTDKSKAICPIAGSPCISVIQHGQSTEGSVSGNNDNKEVENQLNPLSETEEQNSSEIKQVKFT